MPDFLAFTVLALASFRVTRLIIDDTITEDIRKHTVGQLDPNGKLHYMLGCYWCCGLWICACATLLYLAWPTQTVWLAFPFALSTIVAFLALHDT